MAKKARRVNIQGAVTLTESRKRSRKSAKIKSTKKSKKSKSKSKRKSTKTKKPRAAPKGKKKGAAKSKVRRKRVMQVFEAPVDVDVVVVPKVRLRVGMRMPDGTVAPLEPLPAEPPKVEGKAEGDGAGGEAKSD